MTDQLEAIHADPWTEELVDLQSLNAGAAAAIERMIQETRHAARNTPAKLRSRSLVVLGPPGAGKTHLFARLRWRLGPRAVFVHIRPLLHAPISPQFVLGELVRQLGYRSQALPQIDALVGSLLAHLAGDASFPNLFLAEYRQLAAPERNARLEAALEQTLELWQDLEESYLARLLGTPFEPPRTQRAQLAWLSGADCDPSQLERIGAGASLAPELALRALRSLGSIASLGAPIVLVFDQLENLIERGAAGERLLAYAHLVAELVDSTRGFVIVQMALDTEWSRGILPNLNLSQRSRVQMATELLALPSADQREELLRLWVERLPDRPAPFPWPFSDSNLAALRESPGVTPRMLLVALRSALAGEPLTGVGVGPEPEAELGADGRVIPAAAAEAAPTMEDSAGEDGPLPLLELDAYQELEQEWANQLATAQRAIDEAIEQRASLNSSRLCDGLLVLARVSDGLSLAPASGADPAQLVRDARGERVFVAVLGQSHHKSLSTAFTRLTSLTQRARVIALRERWRVLPPTWTGTNERKRALLATGRARYLELDREEISQVLALDALLQAARSGDVTGHDGRPVSESAVVDWVRSSLAPEGWRLSQELRAGEAAEPDGEEGAVIGAAEQATREPARGALSTALLVLHRLRIASLDRLIREVTRIDRAATRAAVIAELNALGGKVRRWGRNIVGLAEDEP